MSEPRPYTRAELEQADRLNRVDGLTVPEIAVRLNRPPGSLKVTLWRFRRGTWRPRDLTPASFDAEVEALIGAGLTNVSALARLFGLRAGTMASRLRTRGLDAEMREELAIDAA